MYDQIASNKRRSIALVAGFVVVLALVGAAVGLLIGTVAGASIIKSICPATRSCMAGPPPR